MTDYVWLIIAFPLAGALANHFLGRRLPEPLPGLLASGAIGASFIYAAVAAVPFVRGGERAEEAIEVVRLFDWIPAVGAHAELLWDPLSAMMTLVITGIGTLIHLYSIGYMHGDERFGRYFSYMNLFAASMLILVLANNFGLLFVGWELVGLCSYLLISFWFTRPTAAAAGKKAFIVNRIGDFGFMIALMIIFTSFGTLSFTEVLHDPGAVITASTATAVGLLLLVGAAGKSAQIPLYVWLPDAMEGPTPVSALIHAATMVTAGVYLVARAGAIFELSPVAGGVVAVVGAATALFAAMVAIAQNDIKRVLAYSTISQLGYMFMAVGVAGYVAGVFHLFTHAGFKALLFLGAGSVMHGMHDQQDMTKMGGLLRKMPITAATMGIATLAIAGVPPLSGFWSKDEILAVVFEAGGWHWILWAVGVLTALITAFYMTRQFALVFLGKPRWDEGVEPHESPGVMTGQLMGLAVLAAGAGFLNSPLINVVPFEHFLEPSFEGVKVAHPPEEISLQLLLAGISVIAAVVGIGMALFLYARASDEVRARFLGLFRRPWFVWENAFWVDQVYGKLIVAPGKRISEWLATAFDQSLVDGIVNGVGGVTRRVGALLRPIQSGFVRAYGALFAVGAAALIAWAVSRGL
jgi:NADH-quinone oxidoreductase subunit L